ncbi:MAG: hypothetical protein AB7D40_00595 [Bacteroidales bacterium]
MIRKDTTKRLKKWMAVALLLFALASCEDHFSYLEDQTPDWLGDNIYDYLKDRGDCNYYVQLIDDCGYTETMQKTGSNTLFFSADSTFERYFSSDAGRRAGITSYEEMPLSMKLLLLRSSMVSNAQLIERLSYSDKGGILFRRTTMMDITDTIPMVAYEEMPKNAYFSEFKDQTVPMFMDATQWTMVQFFPEVRQAKKITDDDMQIITGIKPGEEDAYVFGSKIIHKDITCKNGYLHELGSLLFPPDNMAEYIRRNSDLNTFNQLMDRFCQPMLFDTDPDGTKVYQLRYFNRDLMKTGRSLTTDLNGKAAPGLLYYDPGWNLYAASANTTNQNAFEMDMAAMFVPNNEAMQDYFNEDPSSEGYDLYVAFDGDWSKVPDNIAADFVANHQKASFIASLPSQFETIKDEAGYEMEIEKENIVSSFVGRNGLVYTINKVLPPLDYRSVMGPVKIDQGMKILNMAMGDTYCQFQYYLRSLKSTFHFFVTPDEHMKDYIDPVSMGHATSRRATWNFYLNANSAIQATLYSLATGDSIGINNSGGTSGQLTSRLTDILNQQTLVGEVVPGQEWYITKGFAPLRLFWEGNAISAVQGAGNDQALQVTKVYEKTNGFTYYINGIAQPSRTSIYQTLARHAGASVAGSVDDKFKLFYDICNEMGLFIASPTSTTRALDYKIDFLNQFHYTIYVPTNAAIQKAWDEGLMPSLDAINNVTLTAEEEAAGISIVEKADSLRSKLKRFIRYHFQDYAVCLKGKEVNGVPYLSATLNESTNKFFPIYVKQDGSSIVLTDYYNAQKPMAERQTIRVLTSDDLYNLMARDIVVNASNTTAANKIETYSYGVLHQIEDVLRFE